MYVFNANDEMLYIEFLVHKILDWKNLNVMYFEIYIEPLLDKLIRMLYYLH
jgi:hypothetical protein